MQKAKKILLQKVSCLWCYIHHKCHIWMQVDNLSRLEKEDCYLSKIEIDEMFRLVSDIWPKVPANYAMPSWIVFLVKLFLYKCSYILFDVEFFHCLSCTLYAILLHVFGHISILDHSFSLSHLSSKNPDLVFSNFPTEDTFSRLNWNKHKHIPCLKIISTNLASAWSSQGSENFNSQIHYILCWFCTPKCLCLSSWQFWLADRNRYFTVIGLH